MTNCHNKLQLREQISESLTYQNSRLTGAEFDLKTEERTIIIY